MTAHTDDALETYRALLRTVRRLRRFVNAAVKEHGLTGAQFALLTSIPPEGIPLTQLASRSWADPGNVSGTVDRLEEAGWVERRRSPEDRRVVLICLSERGAKLLETLVPQHRAAVAEAFRGLNGEEMAQLRRLLGAILPGDTEGVGDPWP